MLVFAKWSSGADQVSYLSAAERAASWSQCPEGLQPGSWADCQCCWPPVGGSAGSQGADRLNVKNRLTWGLQILEIDHMTTPAEKEQPVYLWACVASQCCCSMLQRGRRAWLRLMKRQAGITVQLRAEHLREELYEVIKTRKCWWYMLTQTHMMADGVFTTMLEVQLKSTMDELQAPAGNQWLKAWLAFCCECYWTLMLVK